MKKVKPAEADVLLRLMQMAEAPHSLEAMQYVVFQFDFQEYEQFIIEAPPGSIRFNNLIRVAQFYDSLGALVEGGVIDPDVLFEIFPVPWGKVEPIIAGMRRELEWPDLFDHFEGLNRAYRRWWEEKRKRQKLSGEAPPPAARPKLVALQRPAAPVRPAQTGVRPGGPGRPGAPRPAGAMPARPSPGGGFRRPATLVNSPVAKPVPRPAAKTRPKTAKPAARKAAKGKGKSKGRKR